MFLHLLPAVVEYCVAKANHFQAGQLAHYFSEWRRLTADPEVLSLIKGARITFEQMPIQGQVKQFLCESDKLLIKQEIDTLLTKGVIKPSGYEAGQIVSPIFLTGKKDGGHRLILNLKKLNENVEYKHFKMEMLTQAIQLMTPDCYMVSIDFKDAYYSVLVHLSHQKYLKFYFEGCLYCYTCFANGLAPCPRLFTKLMNPVLTELRKRGILVTSFIDDSLLLDEDYKSCMNSLIDMLGLVDKLGFVVHPNKSVLEPCQEITYLGFVLNSKTMTVSLTRERAQKICKHCQQLRDITLPTIRFVAKVIGLMVASFPGVLYGPLFYRQLENDKTVALKQSCGNFDGKMSVSNVAKQDLDWWITHVQSTAKSILTAEPKEVMYTDASSTIGWGAVLNGKRCSGAWSHEEKQDHINCLELKAILFALKSWRSVLKNKHVRIMCDNQTAVAAINHMGTSHSTVINQTARTIWLWCIDNDIWLSAAHIAGTLNVEADFQSREAVEFSMEWKLNPDKLKLALSVFCVSPQVDLFASRLNAQCPQYVSYKPDPHCCAVDAFSLSWSNLQFYAFPPFILIHRVLQKICQDKATGVVVVPDWPRRSWYSMLARMCVAPPLLLPPSAHLLNLPSHPQQRHALHRSLSLLICQVSGTSCRRGDFPHTPDITMSHRGAHQQNNSTVPLTDSGKGFVVRGKKIPFLQI